MIFGIRGKLHTETKYAGDIVTHQCNVVMSLVQGNKIKPQDKLRLALVYLLTADVLPSDAHYQRIESAMQADVGHELAALRWRSTSSQKKLSVYTMPLLNAPCNFLERRLVKVGRIRGI